MGQGIFVSRFLYQACFKIKLKSPQKWIPEVSWGWNPSMGPEEVSEPRLQVPCLADFLRESNSEYLEVLLSWELTTSAPSQEATYYLWTQQPFSLVSWFWEKIRRGFSEIEWLVAQEREKFNQILISATYKFHELRQVILTSLPSKFTHLQIEDLSI